MSNAFATWRRLPTVNSQKNIKLKAEVGCREKGKGRCKIISSGKESDLFVGLPIF